jgi:hypothetical protein
MNKYFLVKPTVTKLKMAKLTMNKTKMVKGTNE